ncbi:MAG: hypothetical protein KUG51_01080 [Urechidicola sp.]|nr:hypothetical protein [Urechidicola sp.]
MHLKIKMKKAILIFLSIFAILSCEPKKKLDVETFKQGTFEILADEKYEKTTFKRIGDLQIEYYEDRVDTLSIHWKNNFNYTLQMLHPKSKLDNEPINVKLKSITTNSYDFEAVIGHSNFVIKGTVIKISE